MRKLTVILIILIGAAGGVYLGARYARRDPLGSGPRLKVTFLKAELGGGVLLETQQRTFTLIDPGPSQTAEALCSYLTERDVTRITVVISNDTPKRSGALTTINEGFRISRLIRGEITDSSPEFTKLVRQIASGGVPDIVMTAGDDVRLPGSVILLAAAPPSKLYAGKEHDVAENSLVMILRYGKKKFLLPSDIGSVGQNRLIHSDRRITVDVMQTPRYGTYDALSLEFLARVRPAEIIMTSGRPLSLPSRSLMQRVNPANTGAVLHRTDRFGNVEALTDGNRIIFRHEVN